MDFVRQSLNLEDARVVYWTDSLDVIFWLRSRKKLKLFVQNRVNAILQLTRAEQWHHVRGEDNPVDRGTKGCRKTGVGAPVCLQLSLAGDATVERTEEGKWSLNYWIRAAQHRPDVTGSGFVTT